MSENHEKVVLSGINQPVEFKMANMNQAAVEVIKKSSLYTRAVGHIKEDHHRLKLASPVTNNGWDTVSICRVSALNTRIATEKTYPTEQMKYEEGQIAVTGFFAPWQIVTGGDGKNIKLNIPFESGTYTGINMGAGTQFDMKDVSVDIYIKLNYFPLPKPQAEDGSYDLQVKTTQTEDMDPIAAVIALHDPNKKIDDVNASVLRGILEKWLNIPENLAKFDALFATVLINNMGNQSEEYKWLKATTISYAYTDKNTEESSIFGILCMTNNRSADGLPNQLPAVDLQSDENAVFLISREVFVKYQLMPAMPYIFEDSPNASYEVDDAGTTVSCKNLKMEDVRVGAINYHPVAETFEMCFDETYITTTAKIKTNISPGIDTTTIIISKQTLALGTNSKGEQVMIYKTVGEPIVENTNNIATWVVVTEAILGLIAAVVATIAGVIAEKMAACIIGIIAALVVATISIVIHVIIQEVIGGKTTDALPSVAPMVKIATSQIQWPFCRPDAFVLTDIKYSGSIIFDGNLNIQEQYKIKNKRLVLSV